MNEHVRAIFAVSMLRSALEAFGGIWVLLVAWRWGADLGDGLGRLVPTFHTGARPLPGDRAGFVILGALLVVIGVARFCQSLGSHQCKEWARRLGQGLAILDFATPITLPLGLWHLLVYRHPETRERFRERFREQSGADS